MSMFKVVSSDNKVVGLVDTREAALKIVAMRKTGRNGLPINNPAQATTASKFEYSIHEVPDWEHPGHSKG